jgi:hypothetical protein
MNGGMSRCSGCEALPDGLRRWWVRGSLWPDQTAIPDASVFQISTVWRRSERPQPSTRSHRAFRAELKSTAPSRAQDIKQVDGRRSLHDTSTQPRGAPVVEKPAARASRYCGYRSKQSGTLEKKASPPRARASRVRARHSHVTDEACAM